ncbi:MAG TPA: spore coat U domain-containing protein [Thermoanaerobaculia bacterium]|nr:spore coat U domain-containing protein [Thermoanaerobaculia bacterium]
MRNARFLFAFGCVMIATSLFGATQSAPLTVSAEVISNCVIATSNLAFGQYDPLSQNATQELDASAQVTVVCTRNTGATVILDAGRSPMGSTRTLSGTSQHVTYQLYRDAGRTQEWGGGDTGSLQFVSEGVHKPQQVTLYGRIPPGQEVASGLYTDVVTATVDF